MLQGGNLGYITKLWTISCSNPVSWILWVRLSGKTQNPLSATQNAAHQYSLPVNTYSETQQIQPSNGLILCEYTHPYAIP